MMAFDLAKFRDMAFHRAAVPEHGLGSVRDAQKTVEALPHHDPAAALAELTNGVQTMNAAREHVPELRARVLMVLDEAAAPLWRALGRDYLAPEGVPAEEGDSGILRALFDSAAEFASGFAAATDPAAGGSRWIQDNVAKLYLREMRWQGRRLVLGHMLHLPATGSAWERLHGLHALAKAAGVERLQMPAFSTSRYPTSISHEYARLLLLELAAPDGLRPRQVELLYRITSRLAGTVRLGTQADPAANFAVLPTGDARPGRVSDTRGGKKTAPIYINTVNALPRLHALLERDSGRKPSEPDTLYGAEFLLRERTAMVERLLVHWSDTRPQRRGQRVPMVVEAQLVHGFQAVARLIPALQSVPVADAHRGAELQLLISNTAKAASAARESAGPQVHAGRVVDASTGGLGIALPSAGTSWVKHGVLVAAKVGPGGEWVVGVIRRIFPLGKELRIGLQVLASRPRALVLRLDSRGDGSPWADAMRFEESFGEHYQRGILLAPQALPLVSAEILLPPHLAAPAAQFQVPLPNGSQRVGLDSLSEDSEHYQRARFTPVDKAAGMPAVLPALL
jgi:hypothetical protein